MNVEQSHIPIESRVNMVLKEHLSRSLCRMDGIDPGPVMCREDYDMTNPPPWKEYERTIQAVFGSLSHTPDHILNQICRDYRDDFFTLPKVEQDKVRVDVRAWLSALRTNAARTVY